MAGDLGKKKTELEDCYKKLLQFQMDSVSSETPLTRTLWNFGCLHHVHQNMFLQLCGPSFAREDKQKLVKTYTDTTKVDMALNHLTARARLVGPSKLP